MYAIEFEADIKNGVIHLPENYQSLNNKHCKIVLLTHEMRENENIPKKNMFKTFLKEPLIINEFIMPTREERNER